MATLTKSLLSALPAPKQSSTNNADPKKPAGPRIVGANSAESQLVLKRTGPPPYGQRASWRPKSVEDYGDGGAFPEIPIAQYPLEMGRKATASKSRNNALALEVDERGIVKYDAIAKQGHNDKRIVHASFKDLIPLRQRADVGEISLERPSEEEVAEQTEKTRAALAKLVAGAVAAQKPKNIKGTNRPEPTFVRYTPANQMGETGKKNDRIIKIVEKQQDPMEPPKFKHKKIPRGPPSPPPPIMHSPPRKLTAADQEAWTIPPPISNWKNPKGYTVPLDKRLAADGRGLQDVTINDKFAQFSEALFIADRHAREEVKLRSTMQQKLAEKEKMAKEEQLRKLAQQARDEHRATARGRIADRSSRSPSGSERSDSRSRSRTPRRRRSSSRGSESDEEKAIKEREEMRRERRKEAERELRMKRMGTERRVQMLAREQNRDIGEKMALGLVSKPTQSAESMFDARLFNQSSGLGMGAEFNEDQHYDKPLFAAAEISRSIYRPSAGHQDDDEGDGDMERFSKEKRFDVLGRGVFKGAADQEAREGPVQFEKDTSSGVDPFNVDAFLADVKAGQQKKHGLEFSDRHKDTKRARVESDEED
ncbi:mRNA splicing protein [Orbilia oligospora]|uniref:Pre-mRNA-processing protein 45 n=1 Tax=Orbilia oligospora TaxID=2813651 RepID=A0A6G1LV36_ORBOL|nr:mRNA splicing protein [Orbilia oligospora]KAF3206722.1 mRNA splicing protein [Orbilia oligospora]KAF3208430.1 mRNA splicing protein [Orbilia oligospora]KAF3220209.1 mRNA splicing protein [Orbilia oligospora]KAF3234967.1 mRNA splicing protein [Orbilia oligospora]